MAAAAAAAMADDKKESKKFPDVAVNGWLLARFDVVLESIEGISSELDKFELGTHYSDHAFDNVDKLLEWAFVNVHDLLRKRRGPGRVFNDRGEIIEDSRLRLLDLIMQSLSQFTLFHSKTGRALQHLSHLAERRCIGRWTQDDICDAMSFRIRLSLLSFNHRWKMPLDFSLVKVAERKTFQDIFAYDLDEERHKRDLENDPVLRAKEEEEAKRPNPYFYTNGKFTEYELKRNPALTAVFELPGAEFDAMCCYRLVQLRAAKELSPSERDLLRLAAWRIFQNQFAAHVNDKHGGSDIPDIATLSGIAESEILTTGMEKFVYYIATQVNYDRDSGVKGYCKDLFFRLTTPFGFEEIYRADHAQNIDRYDPKLQHMCNRWLERSGRLFDGWAANMSEISEMSVNTTLLYMGKEGEELRAQGNSWHQEVFFYEQFHIYIRLTCDNVHIDKYVIFPSDALKRYKELDETYTRDYPPVERRPLVFCLGSRFYLCVRKRFYECDSLSQACIAWVFAVMRFYRGMLEDGDTSVEPAFNLLTKKSKRNCEDAHVPKTPEAAAAAAAAESTARDKRDQPLKMDIF